MKNHQIRARRAEGSAVSAPEYAVNCLNVDIILAKGRSDVRELSVRLYTSAYRLMGVAARQASSSKAPQARQYVHGISKSLHPMPGRAGRIGLLFMSTAFQAGKRICFFTRAKALIRVPVWKAWSLLRPKCSLPGGWLSRLSS